MKKRQKGFTLVELLVVIAIVAILATVSVVGYLTFNEKAKKSVDQSLCTQYNHLLKAEQALHNDITLSEFMVYIEENGINFNKFNTSSKEYVFAYDKGNTTCVLLDSKTGQVKYPENHTAKELWMVFPENNVLTPTVKNYTLIRPLVVKDAKLFAANNEYTLDLNKYVLDLQVKPECTTLNLENGFFTKVDAATNVLGSQTTETTGNQNVHVGTTETKGEVIKSLKNKVTTTATEYTVKDQYVAFDAPTLLNPGDILPLNPDVSKKVVFENMVFSGTTFYLDNHKYDIEFRNCKFFNIDEGSYLLTTLNYKHNLTIDNCEISNVVRCFNISMPESDKVYKFTNNTFELNKFLTSKGERKDNAIQFAADGDITNVGSLDETTTKIIINNNVVKKANSLIQLHATFCFDDKPLNLNHTLGETSFNKLSKILTINGNTVLNDIPLVVGDPGVQNDLKDAKVSQTEIDAEQAQMDGYVNTILGLIK